MNSISSGGGQCRDQSSAYRFLHERADPSRFGGSQLLQREGDRPHGTFVEVRLVAEAERGVPGVELLRALRSEEHTSELQSQSNLVCRLLLEKKKKTKHDTRLYREKDTTDTRCRLHT